MLGPVNRHYYRKAMRRWRKSRQRAELYVDVGPCKPLLPQGDQTLDNVKQKYSWLVCGISAVENRRCIVHLSLLPLISKTALIIISSTPLLLGYHYHHYHDYSIMRWCVCVCVCECECECVIRYLWVWQPA